MEDQEKGDWIVEKMLGTGGFGLVVLWRNKQTKETIALKQCRLGKDLPLKQAARWQQEVQIMGRLDHVNVVKAIPVPPELEVLPDETPVLAMEYCSKGDLRRVLNRPENCCGLSEITVRCLIRDISNAINYLHTMRIIHRDLKPENIVLQDVDGKTVYKLIDLGYAKELDQGSLCHSFVGTLQYLAPELFLSKNYSRTVDFWSLGLVTHECIVGIRPFLPNMTPAQWMKVVCEKKPSDICVYANRDGTTCYSDKLFAENHLTRPFVESMEKWLQVMVEWDPQKRGITCNSEGEEEVVAFSLLETLLNEKIVNIFSASNGKTYSYKVDEQTSMDALLRLFANDVNAPVEEMEFILPRGLSPDMSKSAVQCWSPQEEDDVDWLLYAFPKTELCAKQVHSQHIYLVEEMLRNKKVLTSYEDQRRMWARAVFFVHQIRQMLRRLLQAHKVLMMNLLVRHIPHLNKTSARMVKDLDKLKAKLEFCQESIKFDKQSYEAQSHQGLMNYTKLENSFQCDAFVRNLSILKSWVSKEENNVNCVNGKMVELQRSPYAQPKRQDGDFDVILKNAAETLQKLREKPKVQRSVPSDNTDMVDVVTYCMRERDKLLRPLFLHLEKVRSCKQEISAVLEPLLKCSATIASLEVELSELQRNRQTLIWKGIKVLVEQLNKLKEKTKLQSGDVSSTSNGPFSGSLGHGSGPFQSYRANTSFTTSDANQMSLSSILCQTSRSSKTVLQENQECISQLQEQLSSLSLNPLEDTCDWGYLESLKSTHDKT